MSDINEIAHGQALSANSPKKVVLLVEDHLETREALSTLLRINGMEVIEAADGIEALNAILLKLPNLILTDLRMPNMDGLELSKHVKSSMAFKHIPIVMFTATPPSDKSRHPEIAMVLQKPFPTTELVTAISQFL
jgi:CheY-like chemotaxis protein